MAYDPISAALDIGGKVIDRIWPDPAQRDAARLELLKMQQTGELAVMAAQTGINQTEAGSASIFVSGWRPAIGWICGAACAWNWVGLPVAKLVLTLFGLTITLAPAEIGEMLPILMGMLGLGGLRTIEKLNDKAAK